MGRSRRRVRFANSTEENFAALLDRLRLTWQYEPHTFVLRTKPDGTPALAFTPDFYLPELQMYVELTTLRQKLVTLKNRKARLLTEQRPEVRLRLLYRRDCQEILRLGRSRTSRQLALQRLNPAPPDEVLGRANWLLSLPRTVAPSGAIVLLGVRLPLGPEWCGRHVRLWVYQGLIEVEYERSIVARFPCSFDSRAHRLEWVLPGEVMHPSGVQQAALALPELEPRRLRGVGGLRRSRRAAPATQLSLAL